MADIQLEDVVWLSVEFVAFAADDEAVGDADSAPPYRGRLERMDDGVYLFADVSIDEPGVQFRFNGQVGAKFRFDEIGAYEDDAVRSTLMWMVYPYVREMVATVTARSPHDAYFMPPMTRMPNPATVEGAPPVEQQPSDGAASGGEPPSAEADEG